MQRPLAFFAASVVFGHSIVAAAAADCAAASDRAAMRTAAMQQELMVAALKCHGINEYNRFVLSHQPELTSSDRALEAYFQRGDKARGTATYNKYKTELANAASLRSSLDPDGFCAAAGRTFDIALQPMNLGEILARVDLESDRAIENRAIENCPVLADNNPPNAMLPPPPLRKSRDAPGTPDPRHANSAPSWDAGNDDDAGQALDSQVQRESDVSPPDWTSDSDPDE